MKIKVNSLPLKEVITDLADAFGTGYTENCDQYIVEIPEHIGSGIIRGINFESGLGIIQYDCNFIEDTEIQFVVNEVHPLKFIYCLKGTLKHRFGNEAEFHIVDQYKNAIVASKNRNGHVLLFEANTNTVISSLEIVRARFLTKIQCELNSTDNRIKTLFNDVNAEEEFFYDGFYSLQLADNIKEIHEFEETDFLTKIFLEGKAYQILTKQILAFKDDLKEAGQRNVLRQSEIRLIEEAAAIMREELSTSDNIETIARRVGLNVNKLQQGFQRLYHTTANQYVHNIRLETAVVHLKNPDFAISDIAGELGLASGSYFSKIFKEKYGVTPLQFRKSYMLGNDSKSIE
ncbi:helix-turn-helix domain-containing protein [Zobellia alginiliquefaciens]|uniref:helix-turn-helix domain-containing protein n=1 Tax=Zobellia alginiliquefaciens TaxID=3032586 RepID=UPI0023E3C5B2|nr:AraC family transcriptional regulator [Zobellia alginiliquefaciens]